MRGLGKLGMTFRRNRQIGEGHLISKSLNSNNTVGLNQYSNSCIEFVQSKNLLMLTTLVIW